MSGVLALALAAAGPIVQLLSDTVSASSAFPTAATASIIISNSGQVTEITGTNYAWLQGGSASNYEIFATLNSGGVTGDTFGSWLNLGTSRSWSLSRSSIGTSTGSITLQIRPAGGSTIATATLSFDVEVN